MVVGVPLGMAGSGNDIPEADGAIFSATGKGLAIGTKGDRPDSTAMAHQHTKDWVLSKVS
jgi:hypothetical protein